jgi:hypothetical protein
MIEDSLDIQDLNISSVKWNVNLHYESLHSSNKTTEDVSADSIIQLNSEIISEQKVDSSNLKIDIIKEGLNRTCIIKGILTGIYLHSSDSDINCQSVKIDNDNLIISVGLNFISIDLNNLKLNWNLNNRGGAFFEFYDFLDDFLLRGETEIIRIDKMGNVKWSYSGFDIWVNMEGKSELNITDNSIILFDFNSSRYEIDFNGREI